MQKQVKEAPSKTHYTMSLSAMYIVDMEDGNYFTALAASPSLRDIIENRIRSSFLSQLRNTIIHTNMGMKFKYSGHETKKREVVTMVFVECNNPRIKLMVAV